ncbi:hypothetical protein [Streptomyces sp. NPDC050388]|uniref:hypothetical protein n=1 Tax=Streptomyces sp. NPDC050388 TaxID=3155781 RepID=UPI0034472CA6
MTAGGERERLVERRLRQALEARAKSVTARDLRPAAPPRPARRRLWWRRVPTSRVGLAGLAGLAAAALAGAAYLMLAPEPADPRPVPPAVPPGTTFPTPSTRPGTTPSATPSPRPSGSLPADRSAAPSTSPSHSFPYGTGGSRE